MENIVSQLSDSPLFAELDLKRLAGYLQQSGSLLKTYTKGQLILFNRGKRDDFLFIIKGKVKVELVSPGGKTIRLRELKKPELLLPGLLNRESSPLPVNMTAIEETTMLNLSKDGLTGLLHENRRFTANFLELLSERFIFLLNKLEFLGFHTISRKLAYYLLSHLDERSGIVKVPMSIKELAELFGVERPSLSKVLGDFTTQGLLEQLSRGEFRVADRDGLVKILI